jgi:hypothetical protein
MGCPLARPDESPLIASTGAEKPRPAPHSGGFGAHRRFACKRVQRRGAVRRGGRHLRSDTRKRCAVLGSPARLRRLRVRAVPVRGGIGCIAHSVAVRFALPRAGMPTAPHSQTKRSGAPWLSGPVPLRRSFRHGVPQQSAQARSAPSIRCSFYDRRAAASCNPLRMVAFASLPAQPVRSAWNVASGPVLPLGVDRKCQPPKDFPSRGVFAWKIIPSFSASLYGPHGRSRTLSGAWRPGGALR